MKELKYDKAMTEVVDGLKREAAKCFGCKPEDLKLVGMGLYLANEAGATGKAKLWSFEGAEKLFAEEDDDE